jgi:hypothetical protein
MSGQRPRITLALHPGYKTRESALALLHALGYPKKQQCASSLTTSRNSSIEAASGCGW